MPERSLPPVYRERALHALRLQGYSTASTERIYGMWVAGQIPPPCVEEQKGKEIGLHTGCACEPCRERLALMFLQSAEALAKRDGHFQ